MTIDNEALLMELQRVSTMSKREKNMRSRGGHHEMALEGAEEHPHKHEHHVGPGIPNDAEPHGRGNHRCHGGSGRHGQNRVLAVLMMQDGTSQKDLAYLLGIRPQSLSEALAKLEEEGFVTRKKNEADGRVINVFITEKGRKRAGKVAQDRERNAADIFGVLTEEEKEQLAAILEKLSAKLEENMEAKKARLERFSGDYSCKDRECCE